MQFAMEDVLVDSARAEQKVAPKRGYAATRAEPNNARYGSERRHAIVRTPFRKLHLNLAAAFDPVTKELLWGAEARTPLDWERTFSLRDQFQTVIFDSQEAAAQPDLASRYNWISPLRQLVVSPLPTHAAAVPPGFEPLACPEGCLVTGLARAFAGSLPSAVLEGNQNLVRTVLDAGLICSATVFCRGPQPWQVVSEVHNTYLQLPSSFRQEPIGNEGVVLTYDFAGQTRGLTPQSMISTPIETKYGSVIQHGFVDLSTGHPGFALQFGNLMDGPPPLVRVHSACMTGDCFRSLRCDCGYELERSLELLKEEGHGLLMYLPGQEGRGIGALQKILAYELQRNGFDTYESNRQLGFAPDLRRYHSAAYFLKRLGIRQIRLISTTCLSD